MPRLSQVSRADAEPGIVTTMYDFIFGDRDPVAEPGLHNGTPGNWWTVVAQSPELMAHCVSGFQFYRGNRDLPVVLRELAQLRVGWARESRFVFSQHTKACRDNGVSEDKIQAIKAWQTSDVYTPAERAVLAWVDALVLQGGRASDETFEALREHLSELAVLELTYIACWYDLHAVMSKALRLELDDVDDRITELTGPGITSSLRPPQSE
ncbi:MAG: carboxymuconolactone decarboxylase family protein [Acidimicrobiales bacterium]|nr:carboxymuconolactone decarboxylase family protein [Acidimicrobiales bacterium]